MLKVTYTETGLHLEYLSESVEDWITVRVLLSLRASQPIVMDPCTASILLRAGLPELRTLKAAARHEEEGAIALSICDDEYVEVTLKGTWVSSQPEQAEGVFVAALTPRTEVVLLNLWCQSQVEASSLRH